MVYYIILHSHMNLPPTPSPVQRAPKKGAGHLQNPIAQGQLLQLRLDRETSSDRGPSNVE